jgi:hypothetical protein
MQVLDCDEDPSALLEADRIVAASPCTAAEIRDRNRQVSIVSKNSLAGLSTAVTRWIPEPRTMLRVNDRGS